MEFGRTNISAPVSASPGLSQRSLAIAASKGNKEKQKIIEQPARLAWQGIINLCYSLPKSMVTLCLPSFGPLDKARALEADSLRKMTSYLRSPELHSSEQHLSKQRC